MNKIIADSRSLKSNADLMDNSITLSNFYSSSQNSSVKNLCDIEEGFGNSNLNNVAGLINNFTPANTVETNYKNFYTIYLRTKDSTYNSIDSLNLYNLAESCPYTAGSVVHQARALYNILYTTYKVFYDNCGEIAMRKINTAKNNIQVILKTQLYPNPNNGNFTIRFDKVIEKQNVEISIFDISGKLLSKENRLTIGNELNISSSLLNGAYTVKIKLPDGTYDLHKIIITK
ncbi:MAG: T9SS type A sorting domain-containing protein [Bacteroidetes bacterium]|nr:T9SS type A sorting domain-containing protein [Bacteroidota bacterium]